MAESSKAHHTNVSCRPQRDLPRAASTSVAMYKVLIKRIACSPSPLSTAIWFSADFRLVGFSLVLDTAQCSYSHALDRFPNCPNVFFFTFMSIHLMCMLKIGKKGGDQDIH